MFEAIKKLTETVTFARKPDTTSPKVARVAAIGLKYPERLTLEDIKIVCASALNQAANKA